MRGWVAHRIDQGDVIALQRQGAPGRHGVLREQAEVEQGLAELNLVDADRPQSRPGTEGQTDPRVQVRFELGHELGRQSVQVGLADLPAPPGGEGHEPADHLDGLVAGGVHAADRGR